MLPVQCVLITVTKVSSTVTVVAVCAIADILDGPVMRISMNARPLHLSVKGVPCVPTLMGVTIARVHSRAQASAMLAVAALALGEERVPVTALTISPATAHPGILESVAKIFWASELI